MHDYGQNKRVFWSRKMLEYFIQLYKQHECLYDMHHKNYNNRCRKMEASENILQKIRKFMPDLQMDDIRIKINAIRTQLSNEFKQIEEAEASGRQYEPKLWCFEHLSFLHKHMRRSSAENVEKKDRPSEVSNEIDDSESDGGNSLFSELNQGKQKRKYGWAREDTLIFIKIFKQFPILYDRNHRNYKNRDRRDDARQKILNEIQCVDPNITLNDVCVKITNLRCQYTRELRRLILAENNHTTYIPKFWCFNELSFLNNKDMVVKRIEEYEEEFQAQSNNNTANYPEEIFDTENNILDETLNDEQIQQNIYINEVEVEYDEKLLNSQNDLIIETEHNDNDIIHGNDINEQNLDDHNPEFLQNDNELTLSALKKPRYCGEIADIKEKEAIAPESNKRSKRKAPTDIQDGKFEWLGDLVVGQMNDISPTFRTDFAWDVQCLIRKYVLKTKEEKESSSLSNDAKKTKSSQDIILPRASNISLNISIL